jgi:predicted nucleic acid-binding protein
VLTRVARGPTAVLSAQVLSELVSVLLRKLKPPMHPAAVYTQVESISRVEDFNAGSRIEGVSFLNPFEGGFEVGHL